ncbi:hypothetical protein A2U01_0099215, partial [Trifolium medium]|nr:hypothetical protein [Trifolium medium]
FGHYRVRARVASFDRSDRNATTVGRIPATETAGWTKGGIGAEKDDGPHKHTRAEAFNGVDDCTMPTRTKVKTGVDN